MQTLQKTVVLLNFHLSLPEANPFMVYLNEMKSKVRNTPDPKGFGFPCFGVLVERDISCVICSSYNLECNEYLRNKLSDFSEEMLCGSLQFLGIISLFLPHLQDPFPQISAMGPVGTPVVSSMMTSKEDRHWCLEHYLPGAPPPSGDRNQGLFPHINLAIIADPVLNDLVPLACSKSS